MTRTTILAGYAVIAAAAVLVQLVALRSGRLPTLAGAVRAVTRWPPVRWALVAGWLWLGWHVFARADL